MRLHTIGSCAVAALLAWCSAAAYAWQQRADYIITATLDTAAQTIGGWELVTYHNNSPAKLDEAYFHLFWNAFRPGSAMERHLRETGSYALARKIAALKPDEQGGVDIGSVTCNGAPVPFKIDETIMRVKLSQTMIVGYPAEFKITFVAHIPSFVRRAGRNGPDSVLYSIAQWFPKVCAFDERGWHNDQYLGREFYADFGRYNVNLTAPHDLMIAGTGFITHPSLVECGYNIYHTDTLIVNPAARDTKVMNAAGKLIDTAATRLWKFEATDVHDFAFAADRDFVHQIYHDRFLTLHIVYKKRDIGQWKEIAKRADTILRYFGKEYGEYPYQDFTIVQAGDGGMEYPQVIFVTGNPPSNAKLVHEIAHQWFYGILANNETAEAWLDEGFATYATNQAMNALFGGAKPPPRTWLGRMLLPPDDPLVDRFLPYLRLAAGGWDEPILQHSDAFREPATYGLVYCKTDAVLTMLRYVVGAPVFRAIMKRYCTEMWLKNPSSADFIRIAEEVSGMDLDWFFDEWLRTADVCDYAIDGVSSKPSGGAYRTTLSMRRIGKAMMPLDLQLTYADGARRRAVPPLGWFVKSEPGALVLPQWTRYVSSYRASFTTPKPVVAAAIVDDSMQVQDMNRLNDATGLFPPLRFGFLTRYAPYSPLDAYGVSFVPRLWYGAQQGAKIGASLDGSYAFSRYIAHAGIYYNTKLRTADWWLQYRTPLAPQLDLFAGAAQEYGNRSLTIGAEKTFRSMLASPVEHTLRFRLHYTDLPSDLYPFYNLLWDRGEVNSARLAYSFAYSSDVRVKIKADYESSLTRQQGFVRSHIEGECTAPLFGAFDMTVRLFEGTSGGAVPVQKRFFLAGASPEEQYENTLYRDIAGVSEPFDTSAHFLLPGGGGLPGYAGQYAAQSALTLGSAVVTLSAQALRGAHNLWIGAFGGVGYLSDNTFPNFSGISVPRFDAGASVRYSFAGGDAALLQSLFLTRAPLSIEFYFPFFVSQPPAGENALKFRWAVGLSEGVD